MKQKAIIRVKMAKRWQKKAKMAKGIINKPFIAFYQPSSPF